MRHQAGVRFVRLDLGFPDNRIGRSWNHDIFANMEQGILSIQKKTVKHSHSVHIPVMKAIYDDVSRKERSEEQRKEMTTMSFGAKIKTLREARGLPRATVDEVFSLMRGTCSNWENGYREPEEELLPELASYFGVGIKDLMGDAA